MMERGVQRVFYWRMGSDEAGLSVLHQGEELLTALSTLTFGICVE